MMSARDPILEMIEKWKDAASPSDDAKRFNRILDNLRYLDRVKFQPFVPTLYSRHPISYMDRLHAWLSNRGLSLDQQQDLFEFAYHIAFFSFDDFAGLFQNAFTGPITRWCLSQAGIRLEDKDWHARLDDERFNKTWFCPVTDSLLISVFHHVNAIEGKSRKPAFRELMCFGDQTADAHRNKIKIHMARAGYKRIVLLEDFVGTGNQTEETIKWTLETLELPVLFCPMIIAPEGAKRYRDLKKDYDIKRKKDPGVPSFEIEPIFELSHDCFVFDAISAPSPLLERIRRLAEDVHARLSKTKEECKDGALGYWNAGSPQKGATVVKFDNTPNNSLPLIYHSSSNWNCLFPRVARQPL